MSFARLVLSIASNEDLSEVAISQIPPKATAAALVQDCIQKIFIFYPVLPETAAYGSLELFYDQNGRFCSAVDIWNVRMALAIALASKSQVKGDPEYLAAAGHVKAALKHREEVIQPGSVAAVQSTLLLTIYAMLDPSHLSCWYLIGIASRIMVDIGLHQKPFSDPRAKPRDLELRHRVFWCVYSLDR